MIFTSFSCCFKDFQQIVEGLNKPQNTQTHTHPIRIGITFIQKYVRNQSKDTTFEIEKSANELKFQPCDHMVLDLTTEKVLHGQMRSHALMSYVATYANFWPMLSLFSLSNFSFFHPISNLSNKIPTSDIHNWMDEDYLRNCFDSTGEVEIFKWVLL